MIGKSKNVGMALCAAIAAGLAVPASADVKDGVDAWSRGDYAAAVREWVAPAQAGDADAQFNLAQAYRLGRGVDTDLAQAEALYARAAAQGHVQAADNYGLLLFQREQRDQALPYIEAAATRGDPRAQYILGIAHFNGDLVAKNWQRAYALLTLANSTGLPQAKGALTQMDEYIPLADRQAAQVLASQLKSEAEAARARELTAVDLAVGTPESVPPAARPAPAPARETRGADFAQTPRPVTVARAESTVSTTPKPETPVVAPSPQANRSQGPWKLQLGAFGVAGNADRLWEKVSQTPALAGRAKLKEPAGRLTKLLAGGFESRDAATSACAQLKRGGYECLVTR
ncbi:SPOR domain-containing protein [Qipengyuania sp. XHP0211]|uniref:SPOR domain-containing protein n=1 Tax=Qipengyuania sp. XHP0211 TaxID=3038079 RepID=UPI00241F7B71|nr:SPOR domain-containing protein [Qipengyuania sp. XHP0211]MDG5750085.1 SPOR domain-containing protein [Qipengyuania sp. XHP0211]